MSFSRLVAALLVVIVSYVPVAVRAQQTFAAGRSAPTAPSFKKSFGSPPEPVVVVRDLTCAPLDERVTLHVDARFLPTADEVFPTCPIVSTADALRAPPVRPLV
jgi:hypothetical protein